MLCSLRFAFRPVSALALALSLLVGCDSKNPFEEGGGDGNPSQELTEGISFAGGTVRNGMPPAPTGGPDAPIINGAPDLPSAIAPNQQGSLGISFSNVPANTPFDVNVRFDGADSYINIPVGTSTTGGATAGNLNIPFSLSQSICDNLADVQHQIRCYESVSVNGVRVSQEQARQMVLNCGSDGGGGGGGTGSFCAYNYPRDACDLLRQQYQQDDPRISVVFTPGVGNSACNNAGIPADFQFDNGYTEDGGIGPAGACVIIFPANLHEGGGADAAIQDIIRSAREAGVSVDFPQGR